VPPSGASEREPRAVLHELPEQPRAGRAAEPNRRECRDLAVTPYGVSLLTPKRP